jgi:hypothetical protein
MGASGRNAFDARHIRPLGRFLRICTGNEHVCDSHASKRLALLGLRQLIWLQYLVHQRPRHYCLTLNPCTPTMLLYPWRLPCQQKNLCSRFIASFGSPSLSAGPGAKPRLANVACTVSPTVQRCLLTGEKKNSQNFQGVMIDIDSRGYNIRRISTGESKILI